MPTDTAEALGEHRHPHGQGAQGAGAVPSSRSLAAAADGATSRPRRQVEACIGQCAELDRRRRLLRHARPAARAGGERAGRRAADRPRRRGAGAPRPPTPPSADFLRRELLPAGAGVRRRGRERYQPWSRGTSSAPRSTSTRPTPGARPSWPGSTPRWSAVAEQIAPGATVDEAIAALDADPARQLARHGRRSATGCRSSADEAIAELAGTHFDIPEPVRTDRVLHRADHDGGIYYTGPSEDFSRPGPDVVGGAQGRHRVLAPGAR